MTRPFRIRHQLTIHRIANLRHDFLTGEGAARVGGRWNSRGNSVVYCSSHLSLAILEYLVNAQVRLVPENYGRIEVTVPAGVYAQRIHTAEVGLPGLPDQNSTRAIGDEWVRSGASLLLFVPAIPVQGVEENCLINPRHVDFRELGVTAPEPISWDPRLFPVVGLTSP